MFDRFLRYLEEQSIQTRPRERWHVHRRAWNRALAARTDGRFPRIQNVAAERWETLPWKAFPASLRDDLDRYVEAVTVGRKYRAGERPLRPTTIKNYRAALRQHLSRLVESGVPAERFAMLSDCLHLELVQRSLELINGPEQEAICDAARPRLSALMIALISVARYCGVSDEHLAELKMLLKTVVNRSQGMTAKNRARLDQFRQPDALDRFIDLPVAVMRRVEAGGTLTRKAALEIQNAALLALLQAAPMRIRNAANLDLEQHILRPSGGHAGAWLVRIPRTEVKNDRPLEAEIGLASAAILERYVDRYRPLLVDGASTALFPGRDGAPKTSEALSRQLSRFLRRELGLDFNPHLIRHWAAFAYLEAQPGDYETVRQLLGHRAKQRDGASRTRRVQAGRRPR